MELKVIIQSEYDGIILGKYLKYILNLSSRLIRKLKVTNGIFVNEVNCRVNQAIFAEDILRIDMDLGEEISHTEPQDIPLDILYENEGFIAINKTPGMVVHPSANNLDKTIANALLFYFYSKNLKIKIRPVSRLDRDTSGVILFAKNPMIQDALIKQMQTGVFKKEYIGIISGHPQNNKGTIDLPIGRKDASTILREISPNGARSITHYKILKKYKNFSLVKFRLETGRTHQIRVHTLAIGHPLIGDTLYSNESALINRQALHSRRISFVDPINKNVIIITAPTPDDIKSLLVRR